MIGWVVGLNTYTILIICGIRWKVKEIDIDYSKYLGPDYKNDAKKEKFTSTIVSNHVTWLDSVIAC